MPCTTTQLLLVNWDLLGHWTGQPYPSVSLQKQPWPLVSKPGVCTEDSCLTVYCSLRVASVAASLFPMGDQTATAQVLSRTAFYWYHLTKCLRITREHLLESSTVQHSIFLGPVKNEIDFQPSFWHVSHDVAVMRRKVPAFFLDKHESQAYCSMTRHLSCSISFQIDSSCPCFR